MGGVGRGYGAYFQPPDLAAELRLRQPEGKLKVSAAPESTQVKICHATGFSIHRGSNLTSQAQPRL
jgi:hypothetical protein